jgi:N-acetylmuramoyl-L-alanine amidase
MSDDIDILARTLWGEARNEGTKGMEAVACVVLNRVEIAKKNGGKYWWGNTVIDVCQKPFQFSCWNMRDPNRAKLIAVTDKNIHFATALRIARRAISGVLHDYTCGATHYHTAAVSPKWAQGVVPDVIIGHHIFYKLEG